MLNTRVACSTVSIPTATVASTSARLWWACRSLQRTLLRTPSSRWRSKCMTRCVATMWLGGCVLARVRTRLSCQVPTQNGDGFITKEELHHVRGLGLVTSAAAHCMTVCAVQVLATVQKLDDNLAGQEVAKVLGSVSTNDEGRLSFQEFKSLASGASCM